MAVFEVRRVRFPDRFTPQKTSNIDLHNKPIFSQQWLISHCHSPWKSLQSIVFKLFALWNQQHSIRYHVSESEILPNEKLVANFGNDH